MLWNALTDYNMMLNREDELTPIDLCLGTRNLEFYFLVLLNVCEILEKQIPDKLVQSLNKSIVKAILHMRVGYKRKKQYSDECYDSINKRYLLLQDKFKTLIGYDLFSKEINSEFDDVVEYNMEERKAVYDLHFNRTENRIIFRIPELDFST